jgi:hypothetical protein
LNVCAGHQAWRIHRQASQGGAIAGKEEWTEHERKRSAAEAKQLDHSALVERLVASGLSRLSAERVAVIQGGEEQPGRARHRRPLRG